jgi:uncharacterized protein
LTGVWAAVAVSVTLCCGLSAPQSVGPDESRRVLTRLDPRAPLVLDIRELGRRPGQMRTLSRVLPAPIGLGTDVAGVPEGAAIELDLRLESVLEGVLVTGTARTRFAGECGRCLDPVEEGLDVDVLELYVYPESDAEDDEAARLQGDLLDLEPVLRDSIVLALPRQPLCREDCPGLCPRCGTALGDDPGHRHDDADPRWAALAGLHISTDISTTKSSTADKET